MFCWLAGLLMEFWTEDYRELLAEDAVGCICSYGADISALALRAKGYRAEGSDIQQFSVGDINEQSIVTQKICSQEGCFNVGDDEVPGKAASGCLNRDGAGTVDRNWAFASPRPKREVMIIAQPMERWLTSRTQVAVAGLSIGGPFVEGRLGRICVR